MNRGWKAHQHDPPRLPCSVGRGAHRAPRRNLDAYISVLVVEEAKVGDVEAAQRRLQAMFGLPILEINARIRAVIESGGYECPTICSPEELGGIEA